MTGASSTYADIYGHETRIAMGVDAQDANDRDVQAGQGGPGDRADGASPRDAGPGAAPRPARRGDRDWAARLFNN